jgi:hypothetical protein
MAGLNQEADMFGPVLAGSRSRALWLGINLLTALLAAAVIRAPQKIAVADLQALTAKAARRLGLEDLPEDDLKARVEDFTDRLKAELRTLAARENLVILKPQAVVCQQPG